MMYKMVRRIGLMLSCVVLFVLPGCVTDRNTLFAEADQHVEAGEYDRATELLEEKREDIYNQKLDLVLYYLDLGILYHYGGEFSVSNDYLDEAERLIELYYSKSITQAVASVLVNDNSIEYPGEDYEDIYINIYKALNYIGLEDYQAAFVEIRRMNDKLAFLETKYAEARDQIASSEEAQEAGEEAQYSRETFPFNESALARFISLLLYRYNNDWDDVRIDFEAIERLFSTDDNLYYFDPPELASSVERLDDEAGRRVSVIAFVGRSPIKKDDTTRVYTGNFNLKISLPYIEDQGTAVSAATVLLGGEKRERLYLMEDTATIAETTFERRKGIIYTKTVIRALTKAIAGATAQVVADETAGGFASLLVGVGNLALQETEQSDLRISRYLPSQVYVGDFVLAEDDGSQITIDFLTSSGATACSYSLSEEIFSPRRLNILSLYCPR